METLEKSEAVIRSRNMRVTPQRRAVMQFLKDNRNHPTVEDVASHVQEAMPNVALSTVYNILHEFVELGLISQFEFGGIMHFDPGTHCHAHYYCELCGTVYDIDLSDELVESLYATAVQAGFSCNNASLKFTGQCPHCVSQ